MARTVPVNPGYTIKNGTGTGPNGNRIDVWVEYKCESPDVVGNYTPFKAYFYAALNPSYSATTAGPVGRTSSFTVNGITSELSGSYDFSSSAKVNQFGRFSGNIAHNNNGTKKIKIKASFTTPSTWITGGTVPEFEVTLPDIPRAAVISNVAATELEQKCDISWIVNVASHRFKLKFSCGTWSYTTGILYPGAVGVYRYTDLTLPMELAREFKTETGLMDLTLYTYSDNGVTLLGSADTKRFTVTVPETAETRPTAAMTLISSSTDFGGNVVQGVTGIVATVTGSDPTGADIVKAEYTVQGKTISSGTASGVINAAGSVEVVGTVTNSRGFRGTVLQAVQVLPYEKPRLYAVEVYRCDSQGLALEDGTFLRIRAEVLFSSLEVGGTVHNHCKVYMQHRAMGSSYPANKTEIAADTEIADSGALSLNLAVGNSYKVLVTATDTVGNTASWEASVPASQVYCHKPTGGKGMGLGKYCGYDPETDGSGLLDTAWTIRSDTDVQVQSGENERISLKETHRELEDFKAARSGLHFCKARAWGVNSFTLQSRFEAFGDSGSRQSIFIFGCDNTALIQGVIGVDSGGTVRWSGTEGVTGTAHSGGTVAVQMPHVAYDYIMCISADPVSVV